MKTHLPRFAFVLATVLAVAAQDRVPIKPIRAIFNPARTNIVVTFSGVAGPTGLDPQHYRLITQDGSRIQATGTDGYEYTGIDIPVFWEGVSLPGDFKSIEISDVGDTYDPPMLMSPNPTRLPIEKFVLFGSAEAGVGAAQDAELSADPFYADKALGLNYTVTVNSDPKSPTATRQALLRFPLPHGPSLIPIPPGTVITDARLELTPTMSGYGVPSLFSLHRMLIPWDEPNVTWNSTINGVSTNNIEARATADTLFSSTGEWHVHPVPVTAAVLDWMLHDAPNYGWLIQSHMTAKLEFYSAQYIESMRPILRVLYVDPPDLRAELQPDGVRVSWDVPGFRLEERDFVIDSTWQPTLGRETSPVTISPSNASKLFRLYHAPQ